MPDKIGEAFNPDVPHLLSKVLPKIIDEMHAQRAKWGEQNHPDGTGPLGFQKHIKDVADRYRLVCQAAAADGTLTWRHIFMEEVFEALAETEDELETEIIQVMAVCASWLAARHRRESSEPRPSQKS
jgi:hypothetical protein